MKRIDGYQCDNCGEIHNTAQLATDCEKMHEERLKAVSVRGSFASQFGTYGLNRVNTKLYPKTLFVKFSDGWGDYAQYTLTQIGPKAV